MTAGLLIALLSLAAWIYLLGFRGLFWAFRERDDCSGDGNLHTNTPPPANRKRDLPASLQRGGNAIGGRLETWPAVVAVVPARDEADCIERSLRSLAAQEYPGEFRIIVVDDQSKDDTPGRIQNFASERVTLVPGGARPAGWTGKLWALNQGIAAAGAADPEFFWLTDADIEHSRDNLAQLVLRAEKGGHVLVSLMAELSCKSRAERFLIPAFVFFFAML